MQQQTSKNFESYIRSWSEGCGSNRAYVAARWTLHVVEVI